MSPDDSDCCVFVPEQHPHDLVSVGRYAIQKSERNLAPQTTRVILKKTERPHTSLHGPNQPAATFNPSLEAAAFKAESKHANHIGDLVSL